MRAEAHAATTAPSHCHCSRCPSQWVQGCVEQAHNAVYSYLHHLRSFHGDDTFNWAELLPSVAYTHNTAVQTHKSESPMFQRDGRDNRFANADSLLTDEVLHEDEYRKRFDASFGNTCLQQQQQQQHDGEQGEGLNGNTPQLTSAYEARQERAALDNARAVQRNQQRMDKQTTEDDVLFSEGNTVLVRVPQRCRSKFDPATIVGLVRSVHITAVERRYRIATPAGVLNRVLSGSDLAKRTDGVSLRQSDIDAMAAATEDISLQFAVRSAFDRAQAALPRTATAEQRRNRRPPGEWWRSS